MPRNVNRLVLALAVFAACGFATAADAPPDAAEPQAAVPDRADAPRIQLAILLDTSGSMQGLIEQAKSEIWKIVNELIAAKQDGRTPNLQVALYEYGKSSLAAESQWIRQITPLTDDLDKVSEELFKLTTDGGEEYCGAVIDRATRELAWSANHNDLKMIVIAGNEPFSQGPVDYKVACKAAIAKGIVVNTIHCGGGIPDDWRDGAVLADGRPMNIDHNAVAVHIPSPQDQRIAELGAALNATYIPFGEGGADGKLRQEAQDANASSVKAGAAQQRAVAKANAYYKADSWDLVDAWNARKVDPAKVKDAELPENMRKMSAAEREQYLKDKLAERQKIQTEINTLNAEREKFVADKKKELAADGAKTLDSEFSGALRQQAEAKNFKFQ